MWISTSIVLRSADVELNKNKLRVQFSQIQELPKSLNGGRLNSVTINNSGLIRAIGRFS